MTDPRARYAILVAEIEEHRARYYGDDAPLISDGEYDALEREARDIEAQFPELIEPDFYLGVDPSQGAHFARALRDSLVARSTA